MRRRVGRPEESSTVKHAKVWVHQNRKTGVNCPCCNKLVKVYKRRLYSTMAMLLIRFYRLGYDGFVHITKVIELTGLADYRCGDFAKLSYWGLIEEKSNDSTEKRTSGYWKITDLGRDYCSGTVRIPSHVYLYHGECVGFSNELSDVNESLGVKFNYSELIANGSN